jgi:hypothetical protein
VTGSHRSANGGQRLAGRGVLPVDVVDGEVEANVHFENIVALQQVAAGGAIQLAASNAL